MPRIYEEEPIAEINIIPFVDIILVILIIFMVTVPRLVKEGFSVKLPKVTSSKKISSKKFVITINNTGDIFIKGKLLSLSELSFYSKKITENNITSQVVIAADISVSHGRVMEIINTMKESGISNFIFSSR